ncbi:MAG: hypothetical protein ACE1Y2_07595, partial [Stenotrophomonas maltophilia]
FRDEEFSELYCPDNGRDRVPPSLVATKMGMMPQTPGSSPNKSADRPGQHAAGSPIVTAGFILGAADWVALSLCLRPGPVRWLSSSPSRPSRAFRPDF